jgi:hypothetical protein
MDIKCQVWNSVYAKLTKAAAGPFDKLRDRVPLLRSVSLSNWPLSSWQDKNISVSPLGAKSKGANGGVAVGLPHRNYSVFKQAHTN